MNRENFKEVCRKRRTSWGTALLEYFAPHTVRLMARAGFDWLWVENEHCAHTYESILEMARTANDAGIISIARVAQSEYTLIAQMLDLGVDGIIVPRIETPEQMARVVDAARFPPIGKRGFGFRSGHLGKLRSSMAERVADQNGQRFLFIQIESRLGIKNIEGIVEAARGQLDGIFFGPADFQMDLGKPDTPGDPELAAAARRIVEVATRHGLSNGLPVGTPEDAKRWRDIGYNLITVGSEESFMTDGAVHTREALSAEG